MRIRNERLTTTVVALTLLVLAGCANETKLDEPIRPPRASAPFALRVTDLDGHVHDLDAELSQGRLVALVFWQSWCLPCKREAPEIVRASHEYGDAIRFIGVVSGPDEAVDDDAVRKFITDHELDYPQVRDRDLAITDRFVVRGTPTIIVLGDQGRELFRGHRAPKDWSLLIPPGRRKTARSDVSNPAASTVLLEPVERRRETTVMGTSLEITTIGPDPELLERAMDAAVAEMRRVEDLMTDWRPSPLTALNDAAGGGPQPADPEILRLLARAVKIGELTGGAFDVTYAGVGQLWRFEGGKVRRPSDEEIAASLSLVDGTRLGLDLERRTLELPDGFRIGLGGIAKGYGVDRAMKVLREHGVEHAVVNAGGDMKVLGQEFDQPWDIAIKHPRKDERALAVLQISNTCVVTSGDYERFFEFEGKRYHHIIDPRDGHPARGAVSATVVAPDAAFADALATALCVLGPEAGLPIIEKLPRVEAILVDLEGGVHVSTGLSRWVEGPWEGTPGTVDAPPSPSAAAKPAPRAGSERGSERS